jgi:hypothetical protein
MSEESEFDELTTCPSCEEGVRRGATKCPHCLAWIDAAPDHGGVCPFCKEQIHPEAVRCRHCKSDLGPSPASMISVGPVEGRVVGVVSGCDGCQSATPVAIQARAGTGSGGGIKTRTYCFPFHRSLSSWGRRPGQGRHLVYLRRSAGQGSGRCLARAQSWARRHGPVNYVLTVDRRSRRRGYLLRLRRCAVGRTGTRSEPT